MQRSWAEHTRCGRTSKQLLLLLLLLPGLLPLIADLIVVEIYKQQPHKVIVASKKKVLVAHVTPTQRFLPLTWAGTLPGRTSVRKKRQMRNNAVRTTTTTTTEEDFTFELVHKMASWLYANRRFWHKDVRWLMHQVGGVVRVWWRCCDDPGR